MTDYAERPERPVAALWRACGLLEAADAVPLQATEAFNLLTYRARLEVRHERCGISAAGANAPGQISPVYGHDPDPEWRHQTAGEAGPEAAAMLRLLSFGQKVR
ncbi:type IV pilus biogenesis protein PilM [Methylotetracoccus oryzae]|uniref:hypothetical protein n=1 Tax=Methylotetracoccus oryzae TaxID=1919059 RepID=UPI00111A455A|nr:hypothetical protein [Methylotetracoccus oryzae]